jgi:hypothetical protein
MQPHRSTEATAAGSIPPPPTKAGCATTARAVDPKASVFDRSP